MARTWRAPYILALWVLLAFSGCAFLRPPPPRLPLAMPEVFLNDPATEPSTAAPLGKWWEAFGDPRLNNLMLDVLQNNLDVAQAYARLAQLEATARGTSAARLPFVNGEGQSSRNQQQSFLGETKGTNYSLSLAAGFELDLWQKLKSRSDAAHLAASASRQDIKALYITLSAQLADLYFLAIEQRSQLALADRIIATLEDSRTRVERRYEQGLAEPKDVYQARQNLLKARENRPQLEAQLATTLHAISVLAGKFPRLDVAGREATLPGAPDLPAPGLPAQLLNQRPDLNAAFLRLQAKDAEIAAAIADRLPAINLLANYGKAHSALGSITSTGIFWDLIANATAPIIDGGRRRAEVSRSRAAFAETLAHYKQSLLEAVKEVEDALSNNAATKNKLKYLEARTLATAASLRLATSDYYEGITDYLPVLLAQQTHFEAQSQVLSAKRQLLSDRISLFRALGGNWPEQIMHMHVSSNEAKKTTP